MQKTATETTPRPDTDQRLPWRKPGIQRLVVSVDTKNGGASPADIGGFGPIILVDDLDN